MNRGVSENQTVQGPQIPPHPLQGVHDICSVKFSGATRTSEVKLERKGLPSLVVRSNNRLRATSALYSRPYAFARLPPQVWFARALLWGFI